MREASFCKLPDLIKINEHFEMKLPRAIPNGKIQLFARVSMAIRWFSVGSSYDIAVNHGAYYQEIMKSV